MKYLLKHDECVVFHDMQERKDLATRMEALGWRFESASRHEIMNLNSVFPILLGTQDACGYTSLSPYGRTGIPPSELRRRIEAEEQKLVMRYAPRGKGPVGLPGNDGIAIGDTVEVVADMPVTLANGLTVGAKGRVVADEGGKNILIDFGRDIGGHRFSREPSVQPGHGWILWREQVRKVYDTHIAIGDVVEVIANEGRYLRAGERGTVLRIHGDDGSIQSHKPSYGSGEWITPLTNLKKITGAAPTAVTNTRSQDEQVHRTSEGGRNGRTTGKGVAAGRIHGQVAVGRRPVGHPAETRRGRGAVGHAEIRGNTGHGSH